MKLLVIIFTMLMLTNLEAQESYNMIIYKKGACFGKCPVYTVSISKDGLMSFHGVANLDMIGKFERQLSKKEFRKIKRKFKKAKMHKLDDEYGMNVMDVPMTTFKYNSKKLSKTIKVKLETPEKLIKAEQYLLSLIKVAEKDIQWTIIDQTIIKKEVEDSALEGSGRKEMPQPKIIVQLHPETDVDTWLKKYQDYNLKVEKKLSPNRPLYLLLFNPGEINPERLLAKLNSDDGVNSAELNKKVKLRDR